MSVCKQPPTTLTEALAELLDDPLPPDWRDELARQARQEHLETLAHIAADAAVELMLARDMGEKLAANGPQVMACVDALRQLDRGWRRFVHDTDSEAEAIVTDALTLCAGEKVMLWMMASLGQMREHERVIIRELHPDT